MRLCALCRLPGHTRRTCERRTRLAALPPIGRAAVDPPVSNASQPSNVVPMTPAEVQAHYRLGVDIHEAETNLRDSSYELIRQVGLALAKQA